MPKAKRFDITVLLMSGRSLALSVKKKQTLSWVAEWVDTTWGLRCIAYDVIHNDKVLAWEERTTLPGIGHLRSDHSHSSDSGTWSSADVSTDLR